MPYRNKTYVCFDGDNDIKYYRMMQAWKDNDNFNFNFYDAHDLTTIRSWSGEDTIKASLRERMRNSNLLVVLVGEKTKNCHTYVRWEIELAGKHGMPIIAVNLNGTRQMDPERCPAILREKLAIHIPFRERIMTHAQDNWPTNHTNLTREGKTGPYYYQESIYQQLGLGQPLPPMWFQGAR